MSEVVEDGKLVMTLDGVRIRTLAYFGCGGVWEYSDGRWERIDISSSESEPQTRQAKSQSS